MKDISEIIKGCILWNSAAQEELYKLYSKKMYWTCLYYSKDQTEAEDVLQEGFVKVFNNIKQFDNKGSFEGWMKRIMINTALERHRKKKFLYTVEDISEYESNIDENKYDDNNISSQISEQELLKMIQELTPQYRMVFNLYAVEGYSHAEIADKLNISEGTSKSNLARARQILQEKVKKYFDSLSKNINMYYEK